MILAGLRRFCTGVVFFLLLSICVRAQDAALSGIIASRDDTGKTAALVRYIRLYLETDLEKTNLAREQLAKLGERTQDRYAKGMALFFTAYLDGKILKDETAVENYQAALKEFTAIGNTERMAACHLNMALIYDRKGNIEEKMRSLSKAINLLDGTPDKPMLNKAYLQMGAMMLNMENYTRALFYLEKVVNIAREIKDTASLVSGLCGLSFRQASLRQFERARQYVNEAVDIARAEGNVKTLISAHYGLVELYRKWEKAEPTIYYSRQMLQYAVQSGDPQTELYANIGLADGYGLTNDKKKTIYYLNKALSIAEAKGLVYHTTTIYKGLSETYNQLNRPAMALEYYKKYIVFRDSTSNQKVKREANELEIKYQAAQKEKALSQKQLLLAQKDLQIQKSRSYMYYLFAGLVIALFGAVLLLLRSKHKKTVHARELKSVQQQKELQLLEAVMQGEEKERSRIAKDLHDGVAGMLAAVKMHFSSIRSADEGVVHTEGYQQGMQLLNEATQEIRKTSHNLMPEVLLRHGLDLALQRYCHNLDNSKAVTIQYDSWGEIDRYVENFELSVYRIVQELLNNIIKHSRASEATVQLTQQNELLVLTIEDNGVGFSRDTPSDGMGLQNLRQRINALGGKMEINTSENNGVSAYLEFDITSLKKERILQP